MTQRIPPVVAVQPLERRHLRLRFADGREGVVDVSALVDFDGVLSALGDPGTFREVRVESGTATWPGDIDLAPETLYWAATGDLPAGPAPADSARIAGAHRRADSAPPPLGPFVTTSEEPAPGTESPVPEISRFLGIVIRMFYAEHEAPHFHAHYSGRSGRFEIATLRVLDGDLPARVCGLIVEWASLHREELIDDWERAKRHEPLHRIAPLA
ncbi:MAG: DUF4160 domain-containing protein [Candidatus Eisenbacteria bacterium]|uniref:DUF4160 domain-containing protein n=1 Tax=Eiseniibacteriota bacterium TaxID=2212470 RepID=A0A538UCE4_UNCEI|nr:MAG: DUF4160 domain-containing protein [Candidatus Eisenbacteria bacterium]